MRYQISFEEFKQLIAYADDDKLVVDPDLLLRFNDLHADIERNVLKAFTGARKRNTLLQEKVNRLVEKRDSKILAGEFKETGLDSYEVAQALLYQLQQVRTYKLTKGKVILILYEMYASWLNSKQERLFLEKPVATEYGPQFWRVWKRLNVSSRVPYDEYKALAEKNPGVAKFCYNAAQKYFDYSDDTLKHLFMKSKAFKNASKENNGGKWNKEIDDRDIYAWKKEQNEAAVV